MSGSWLDRNRHLVFITLLVLSAGGAALFYLRQPSPTTVEIQPVVATATAPPTISPSPTFTSTPIPAPVRVYVTGAIAHSDVYFLPAGSIIKDAIVAAGGFTSDADREHINQALELQDQQQIHVPRLGETSAPIAPSGQGGATPTNRSVGAKVTPVEEGPININTATLEQLDSLPGIGPAIARRIIDYREKVNGFKSADQLTEVSGIGEATLAKIKDLITVK
jgi:competence protein ComEA